ncbi:hypothetical protein, partial [Burkholderia multivorans]|uniref:hypothetical protein n=1 Tax=Burkholderia multivorans TaxID=87883 RepID=UPI0021BF0A21
SLPGANPMHIIGRNQIDGETGRAHTASLLPRFHVTVASRCGHKVAPSWRGLACNSGANVLFPGLFCQTERLPRHPYMRT